uniref:Uncharacterized protein n=1 Tax=Glossina brevipalpis TaxID=37001 RepID=A0A1A9W4Y6_9MUSC
MLTVLVQEPGDEHDAEDAGSQPPTSRAPTALSVTSVAPSKTKDSLNLGMAQIVVTAATPLVEDGTGKSFPPVDEEMGSNSAQEKDATTACAKTATVTKTVATEDDAGSRDVKKIIKIDKEIEGRKAIEACTVTVTLTSPSPYPDDSQSLSDQDLDTSDIPSLKEAQDPFNENAAATATTLADTNANADAFDANFEVNFEDAFAGGATEDYANNIENKEENVQAPKQVVGGRASIPEELDSNQLARLQNLKESNA